MDRINIKCPIEGQELELQFDKKAMPGEAGPCFMITVGGCFKGYISRQKNGTYQPIGTPYYTAQDLQVIGEHLRKQMW
ncbi:hypothetical protein AB6735_15075 [Mucilaginibacter sp. RCC_168]|uniref:hypothetical protein n=1 Tax=Mucilaginibacter sp. RCC_168 TaxID=3239221 RepID=UPI00352414A8